MRQAAMEKSLTLSGDAFESLKDDFDQVLKKTLRNMEQKSSENADIIIKLKISLMKESVPDSISNISGKHREVVVPKFDHKVSSVMQIKDEITGSVGGNCELVWDEACGVWVMRDIVPRFAVRTVDSF